MKQKTVFITALVILVALFGIGVFAYRTHQAEQAAAVAAKNRTSLSRADAPALGRAEARVQVVEFFDPACETCAAFYPMVKKLIGEHRDDIRLVIRYAPLHQGSDQVVLALEAARKQGRFWQALEALLANQSAWVHNHRSRPDLIWPHLERAGLDVQRLQADMNLPDVQRAVAQDVADGRALNVTKTPEFFVNGRPLPSFGFEQLRALISEELGGQAK
jgi:protein-disulfide isomerase